MPKLRAQILSDRHYRNCIVFFCHFNNINCIFLLELNTITCDADSECAIVVASRNLYRSDTTMQLNVCFFVLCLLKRTRVRDTYYTEMMYVPICKRDNGLVFTIV